MFSSYSSGPDWALSSPHLYQVRTLYRHALHVLTMLNSPTPPVGSFTCVKRMTVPKAPHLHFMLDSSVHPINSFIQAHLKVCYLTTFVTVIPGDLSGIIDPAYLAASIIQRPPTTFYLTHFSHMCVTSQATLVFQG